MEGVGIAASILAIATAGVQTSIKLTSFSNQVTTAADRIRSIGSAVSLTSNVLQQIGELMTSSDGNAATSIFNNNSLRTTQASAEACERIFQALKDVLMKSSKQLLQQKDTISGKVILSKLEALKWPFFQPGIDTLCMDLRDARETLMLILQVTTLAYSKKLAALNLPSSLTADDHSLLVGAIVALNQTIASSKAKKAIHNEPTPPQDEPGAGRYEIPAATMPSLADEWETVSSQTKQSGAVNPKIPKHLLFRPTAKTAKTSAVNSVTSLQQSLESSSSTRETTLEAYLATPFFNYHIASIEWDIVELPLKQTDLQRQLNKLSWWRRDDVFTQLSNLSNTELRLIETLQDSREGVTISRITFRKMSPSKDPITGIPLRRILIVLDCSASKDEETPWNERARSQHHGMSDTHEALPVAQPRGSYMPEVAMDGVDSEVDEIYHNDNLDPEHGDEGAERLDEEMAERIVNDLLAKYTTLEI